ncbi:hypothetical protein B0H17DRAFT_1060317 [Mycena rosella]|uniref:Uncharacterized protein n=1 Tax=Mycena rosella TaxID=1033263 RepID=A0AAD7DJE9_MYCRO|nr:hypothetical protein B0H17DRAFT_1060317 [Mycena rosella]
MAPSSRPPRTAVDDDLIDSLSGRDLIAFRDYIHSPAHIRSNAAVFLDNAWIDVSELRSFLRERDSGPSSLTLPPPRVKLENPDLALAVFVKVEPGSKPALPSKPVFRTRTEGGREIFEILSDSDSDPGSANNGTGVDFDSDFEVADALLRSSRSSSVPALAGIASDSEPDDEPRGQESYTIWQDSGLSSELLVGEFRLTMKLTVKQIEYVSGGFPSIWPIPRVPTAFILSSDSTAIDPDTGLLYTMDHLIKNHDNDSWQSSSGKSNSFPMVVFEPGMPPIKCRRARMTCKGGHACERVDPKLMHVERYDLDPTSRDAVFAAQQDTRRREGTTAEDRTAGFFDIIDKKMCTAIDAAGGKCKGKPKMMLKVHGSSRGHLHWIACTGWRKDFKENHRTFSIPDYVDEAKLIKLFAKEPMVDDNSKDTPPCSRIVPPRTGLKRKFCPHRHIVDGHAVTRSAIKLFPCSAARSIYVPLDPSIRKALVVHKNHTPHSHPMPALTKVSLDIAKAYTTCIESGGIVGATVNKIEHAASTALLLNGQTPALFAPSLQNKRVKRELIHKTKVKKYPAGLGIAGVFQLYMDDRKKPLADRYIHCCKTTPDAATVVRAYVTRSTADYFEILFDEVQRIKFDITGSFLRLKAFVRDGNLLAMIADMEAAQVLGAARSAMKHNDPEYSGIPNNTPASVAATSFVKICFRHTLEAIHDFESLVTPDQYARLKNFLYITSKEELAEFDEFVRGLCIKKIQDWWDHKEMSDWIIPCLVKSQSLIPAEDWEATPATTNTGESQHAWTNSLNGIKLTPVEAIESARKLDETVAREIQASMNTGIIANNQNDAYHRTGRNLQRSSKAAQKVRDSHELTDLSKGIAAEIADLKEIRRQSSAKEKALREQLKAAKPAKRGSVASVASGNRSVVVSTSSTGRVKTATPIFVLDSPLTSPALPSSAVPSPALPAPDSPARTSFAPLEFSPGEFNAADFDAWLASSAAGGAMPDIPMPSVRTPYAAAPYLSDYENYDYGPVNSTSDLPLQLDYDAFCNGWGPGTMEELFNSEFLLNSGADGAGLPYGQDMSYNQLPTLPAPVSPSESSALSPPPIASSSTGQKRPRQEVDEANIIRTSRVRTKSAKQKSTESSAAPRSKRAKTTK